MTFKKLNNITGWLAGLIAIIVYFLTLEPTVSWWDCGEYISTAFKLQVGHPPGAPLFQLLGRFFSLFAGGHLQRTHHRLPLLDHHHAGPQSMDEGRRRCAMGQ